MSRAVLIALLVVIPLVAGTGTGAPAPPRAAVDDIGLLVLDDQARAGFATQDLDVGATLAIERHRAAARLGWYALDERFQASDDQDRRELLFQAATAVEIRTSTLHDEERDLWLAYADGAATTEQLVRELVVLDARTAVLEATLDRIGDYASSVRRLALQGRLRTLEGNLIGSAGPVRQRATEAVRGTAPPARIFAEVSTDGIVLATIDGNQYVREAYRADQRSPSSAGVFSLDDAVSRTAELYPVAYGANTSLQTGISGLGGTLYRIDIEFREGALTAYLDGTTRNVFFEIQERQLDLLAPEESVETVENGTRLVVNRSYAGGPLRIAVYNQTTGAPIETTLQVGEERLDTDARGVVWTLAPADRTRITTIDLDEGASITVFPASPRVVNNTGG